MKADSLASVALLILSLAPAVVVLGIIEGAPIAGLVACLAVIACSAYLFHRAEEKMITEANEFKQYRGSAF